MAFFSKVVNLPSLNTLYKIRTLLTAIDPNAPNVLSNALIKAMSGNTGTVAVGDGAMAAVTDGDELTATDSSFYGGGEAGIILDTNVVYLIADANNQKVLIQGQTI